MSRVTLLLQVYSLSKNVLRVDLYDTNTEEDIHINQKLIEEGFAQFQEESRASKVNNKYDDSNYRNKNRNKCCNIAQDSIYLLSKTAKYLTFRDDVAVAMFACQDRKMASM